jgi:hypothetical protein
MIRLFAALAAAALGASTLAMAQVPPTSAQTGALTWVVDDDHAQAGAVEFTLSWRPGPSHQSTIGRTTTFGNLAGLTAAQLGAPTMGLVRFRVTRDAGTFDCEGSAKAGHGAGTCDFAESRAFAATLAQRGAGQADPIQLLKLAMDDIGVAYLDELRRQRYATVSVDDLVRAGDHGVGMRYLTAMGQAGYRVGQIGALVQLRDHGVSTRYIEELQAAGFTSLPPDQLVRMRDHGVSGDFLQGLRAAGYGRLPPEDMIRLRDHGVSAGFLAGLQAAGYTGLAPEQVIRLRDHGITTGYIARANAAGGRLDPEELIRRRDRGLD